MNVLLHTVVCAGMPEEKNPGWESIKCVGQSEEIRVIGAQIGKTKSRNAIAGIRPQSGASKGSNAAALLRFNSLSTASGLLTKSSVRTREELSTQD